MTEKTRSPAVAGVADRTAWQHAFFFGGGEGSQESGHLFLENRCP